MRGGVWIKSGWGEEAECKGERRETDQERREDE